MVRSFAAIGGFLQESSDINNAEVSYTYGWRERLLSHSVWILLLIFLVVSALSLFIQLTRAKQEQLEASELSLKLVAQLVAKEVYTNGDLSYDISKLEYEFYTDIISRKFIILDKDGNTLSEHYNNINAIKIVGDLFKDKSAYLYIKQHSGVSQIALANGEIVSAIVRPIGTTGNSLLVYQLLDEELTPWLHRAKLIASVIMCFGAVIIAFMLMFYAQKQRISLIDCIMREKNKSHEDDLYKGRCGKWLWQLGGKEVAFSSSIYRLLDFNKDVVFSRVEMEALLHPEDYNLLSKLESAFEAGHSSFTCLFRMWHKNVGWISFRMRGDFALTRYSEKPVFSAFIVDVTDEYTDSSKLPSLHSHNICKECEKNRSSQAEAHRIDARLREAIESISEAFVLWDEENRLLMCNSKYQTFYGLSDADTLRGTTYDGLMSAAKEPKSLVEIEYCLDIKNGSRSYEVQFEDGSWLLVSERKIEDGGYVSVGTDITSRKLQEQRLIENEQQLKNTVHDLGLSREAYRDQAVKLTELANLYLEQKAEAITANKTKAEFLANMNHEIRTPLNHIIGFSEMIAGEVFGPCGCRRYIEYAQDIKTSGKNLLSMISDILDMACIEAGHVSIERRSVEIADLLERAVSSVRDAALLKDIEIIAEPDYDDVNANRSITLDVKAISQALSHLIRSTIRFSRPKNRIFVRARYAHNYVNIYISSQGSALSSKDIGKILDPFGHIDEMLEDGCKGSGLGVAIARSLIELHGGTIRLRFSENLGSLVMAHLPIFNEIEEESLGG